MSHLIRNNLWEKHLSNEAWREVCSLAWEHGWRPRLPDGWSDTEQNHDALHWQMEYGLKSLTIEETKSLSESLLCGLASGTVKIGKEVLMDAPLCYPYLSRALLHEIAYNTRSDILEIVT